MTEERKTRLKRLQMRSWRRGTKEMDLILGQFANEHLETLSDAQLDRHEELMSENDQDLYVWISGQAEPPAKLRAAIERVVTNLPDKI